MRLVTPAYGTVAISVSADEVTPVNGLIVQDAIEIVAKHYQFAVKPNVPLGIPAFAMQAYVFQSGVMASGENKFPIMQLAMIQNGDVITAQSTEIADVIMDDFISLLDNSLGFRYASAKIRRIYQSNIVVQFELGIEERIEAIGKIEAILNREIERPAVPFKIKRLAFGSGEIPPPAGFPLSIEILENSDFMIERRAATPYSENRYFCSAPVRTSDHVRILETIEREFQPAR